MVETRHSAALLHSVAGAHVEGHIKWHDVIKAFKFQFVPDKEFPRCLYQNLKLKVTLSVKSFGFF